MKYILTCLLFFTTLLLTAQGKFGGGDGSGNGSLKIENAALPIELNHFSATLTDKKQVYIQWSTNVEIESDYFIIEKSPDALHWQILDTQKGAGTSYNLQQYSIVDKRPFQGLSYYRLKQVDFNGHFTYSVIANVTWTTSGFSVFPNPSKEQLKIVRADEGAFTIIITDASGKTALKAQAKNREVLNISHLDDGLYFITINTNNYSSTQQIIIQ